MGKFIKKWEMMEGTEQSLRIFGNDEVTINCFSLSLSGKTKTIKRVLKSEFLNYSKLGFYTCIEQDSFEIIFRKVLRKSNNNNFLCFYKKDNKDIIIFENEIYIPNGGRFTAGGVENFYINGNGNRLVFGGNFSN